MIIGYHIDGQDNDSYMYKKCPKTGYCHLCGAKISMAVNPDFRMVRKGLDFSYTYDGYLIVSQKFKDLCNQNSMSGIEFHEFEVEKDFYCIKVQQELKFDVQKRKTRFIGQQCEKCGSYEEVVGATPVFLLVVSSPLENGIFRTDIEFGERPSRHPLIIVGGETYKLFRKENFNGMDIREVKA